MEYYNETKTALESRDFFISIASHELKTPLTSINVYAQLIQNKLIKKEKIDLKFVENLISSIRKLLQLIEDFLEVDKIKRKNINFNYKKESLRKIIHNIVSDFKLIYPDYKIEFQDNTKNKKDFLEVDSNKLSQAINNLINNSIKFSNKGSKISLSLDSLDNNFLIDIKDEGIGISKKDISRVFEPFFKGRNEKPGMGLGLYLAKEIIIKHKGTINIFSKVNKGTTLRISLPK